MQKDSSPSLFFAPAKNKFTYSTENIESIKEIIPLPHEIKTCLNISQLYYMLSQ